METRIPWFNVNIYIEDAEKYCDGVIITLGKSNFITGRRIIVDEFKDFHRCFHWNDEVMIENIKRYIEERKIYNISIRILKVINGVYIVFISLLK